MARKGRVDRRAGAEAGRGREGRVDGADVSRAAGPDVREFPDENGGAGILGDKKMGQATFHRRLVHAYVRRPTRYFFIIFFKYWKGVAKVALDYAH